MIQQGLILPHLLERARIAWEAQRDFRARRARSRNYYRGRPKEKIIHPELKILVNEEDYIREQGLNPVRMNDIGAGLRNMQGQFRQNKISQSVYAVDRKDNDASEMMSVRLRVVHEINRIKDVDIACWTEALVGGMYGWYTRHVKMHPKTNRPDVRIDPIDPNRVFFNPEMRDVRCFDMNMWGQIHDLSIDEAVSLFAQDVNDEKYLRSIYAHWNPMAIPLTGFHAADSMDFYMSSDTSRCRVIELWQKEYAWRVYAYDTENDTITRQDVSTNDIAVLNAQRLLESLEQGKMNPGFVFLDKEYLPVWRYYFLSPYGHVLAKGTTPFWHEEHPATMGFATMFDGEIWGWVEDQIDPQRMTNRLSTMIDAMFMQGVKGTYMVPEDAVPEGMTQWEFAQQMTKVGGVIFYKSKPGKQAPEPIQTASIPAGIFNWLAMLKQQTKETRGVDDSGLGFEPKSGTPATLYRDRITQGKVTNLDYFESFYATRKERDMKVVQVAAQYTNNEHYIPTETRRVTGENFILYDPERVRQLEYDVVISDSPDTPADRLAYEGEMQQWLVSGRLTFKQFLLLSSHPKADLILRTIEQTNPMFAQQQMNPEALKLLQEQLQQAAAGGDMDSQALLLQAQ
jgi:hypothetical protein